MTNSIMQRTASDEHRIPLVETNEIVPVLQDTQPNEREQDRIETADSIMHGINSFWALVTPVAITMLLASFVAVHYRSITLQQSMKSYLVFQEEQGASSGKVVGESLVNALVIIGFVTVMTFLMVLLYKFDCMKCLVGYIMFASAGILGFEGGQLMDTILIDNFEWPVDWISFLYIMYNFAVVGVVSVFYQKGTSKVFQNGYLVLISVILAWQFSMWPEWTTWIFCTMFAFYDLCAVLTPCGPLKCLIGMIQDKQKPMPGLLYEAEVRDGVGSSPRPVERTKAVEHRTPPETNTESETKASPHLDEHARRTEPAIPEPFDTVDEFKAKLIEFYMHHSPDDAYKADHASERFFEHQDKMWPMLYHKYRTCICPSGQPCTAKLEMMRREAVRAAEKEEDKTIKLGLGDFIFYSVLVSRAALFDFATLVQCFLCIVAGLGGTLFLLAVMHKALPALPFSIFLATIFYFITRYTFIDFANFLGEFPGSV